MLVDGKIFLILFLALLPETPPLSLTSRYAILQDYILGCYYGAGDQDTMEIPVDE
jgi:hypothetical protein